MDQLALVPPAEKPVGPVPVAITEYIEPVAEHNFSRKRMSGLMDALSGLQKTARHQHEVVSQLEVGMKGLISETDLRRAIGLAFQEFEHRLEDTFQDSNRKCLALFSKREDVAEVQGQLGKKVSWHEHNSVLKKLADLRQYVDAMAESVFLGHRDTLNAEFAKKADSAKVDKLLKTKADSQDVSEVRARLERLEVMVSHQDVKQSAALEALRDELLSMYKGEPPPQVVPFKESSVAPTKVVRDVDFTERLSSVENSISMLKDTTSRLMKEQSEVREPRHEVPVQARAASTSTGFNQELLERASSAAAQTTEDLRALAGEQSRFQEASQQKFDEIFDQAHGVKEQVEFLMQAVEMTKRRAKEAGKKTDESLKATTEEQEKLRQQLTAMERNIKRMERQVQAVDRGGSRKEAALDHAGGGALRMLMPAEEGSEPNARLMNVLEQLEKIAGGGQPNDRFAIPYNPERPPLPLGDGSRQPSDADYAKLRNFTSAADSLDSARSSGYRSGFAHSRSMYSPSQLDSSAGAKTAMTTPRKKVLVKAGL